MNLFEAIIDAASETSSGIPSSTTVPTINEYVRWANICQGIIAKDTDILNKTITFPTVAYKRVYDPGAEFVRPHRVEFLNGTSWQELEYMDIKEFRDHSWPNTTSGTPTIYTIWDNDIEIFPAYATAASTFTVNGTITATATSLTVTSTSGAPSAGTLYYAASGEKFNYTSKTATTFDGLIRGVEGTTAAAVTTAGTVAIMNLRADSTVRYIARPYSIYTTGTAVFTNADATVTGTSTYFSTNIYKGWEMGTGTNPSKWYTVDTLTNATGLELTAAYGEATVNPTTYYVSSPPLDIPQQYQPMITAYLVFRTLQRLERTDDARVKYVEFLQMIQDCRMDSNNRGDRYARIG